MTREDEELEQIWARLGDARLEKERLLKARSKAWFWERAAINDEIQNAVHRINDIKTSLRQRGVKIDFDSL